MDPPELASEPPRSRFGAASNSALHLRVLGWVMLGYVDLVLNWTWPIFEWYLYAKGQVPCTGLGPFFKWTKSGWHHSKNGWCHSFYEGKFYVGCRFISISYFLTKWVIRHDTIWRWPAMKAFNFSYLICTCIECILNYVLLICVGWY